MPFFAALLADVMAFPNGIVAMNLATAGSQVVMIVADSKFPPELPEYIFGGLPRPRARGSSPGLTISGGVALPTSAKLRADIGPGRAAAFSVDSPLGSRENAQKHARETGMRVRA